MVIKILFEKTELGRYPYKRVHCLFLCWCRDRAHLTTATLPLESRNSGVRQRVHCAFRIARGDRSNACARANQCRKSLKGVGVESAAAPADNQCRRTTNYPHPAKCALASALQVSKVRHLSRVASKVRHLIFLRSESQSGVSEKNLKARRRNNPVVPDEFVRLRPATTRSRGSRVQKFKVQGESHPSCRLAAQCVTDYPFFFAPCSLLRASVPRLSFVENAARNFVVTSRFR